MSAASVYDSPRHYVELFERAEAVAGGGIYRWLLYDSASDGEGRYRWFIHEDEARAAFAALEARDG